MRTILVLVFIGVSFATFAQEAPASTAASVDPEIIAYQQLLTEANTRLARQVKATTEAQKQIEMLRAQITKSAEKPK